MTFQEEIRNGFSAFLSDGVAKNITLTSNTEYVRLTNYLNAPIILFLKVEGFNRVHKLGLVAELYGWSHQPHINIFYSTGYENLNLSEFVITYSGTSHAVQDLWVKVVNQSGGTLVCSTTNHTHLDMVTTSETNPENVMTTISMHENFMLGGNYTFRTQKLYVGDTGLSEYELTKLKELITS